MMIISSTKKNLPYLYSFHPYAAHFSSRCTSLSRASNKTLTMKGVVPFHLVLDSKKVFSPLNKSFAVGAIQLLDGCHTVAKGLGFLHIMFQVTLDHVFLSGRCPDPV